MSFHGSIVPVGEPIEVYWEPVGQVEEHEASGHLRLAIAGRGDSHVFVFLQSGVYDIEDAAPIGYFDVALNEVTGEVCGFLMRNEVAGPIWTVAAPGDHEGAVLKIRNCLIQLGFLAGRRIGD